MNKIGFIAQNQDISRGSYRIWVNDLNEYFKQVGINSTICGSVAEAESCEVLICSKDEVNVATHLKSTYPHKKVGVVNLAADTKDLPIDFVIVGSVEEKDSLSHYNNIFLFPLIEAMFQDVPVKQHRDKANLIIGCHGSHTHLGKFKPALCAALEELDEKIDLELRLITSSEDFKWEVGRPDIKNIKIKRWDIHTIQEDLSRCDIGVVPNITSMHSQLSEFSTSAELGLYSTDYLMRYKNKSNAGRSFVFHQLGIPVVADLTPSNLHILGNPDCGFVAHSKEGWKKSILQLANHEARQFIADNAKREFDRLYDPLVWAQRLYKNIIGVSDE